MDREVFRDRWTRVRARTRTMFEGITPDNIDFRPGDDSRSVRELAVHVVACESSVLNGITRGEFSWKDDVARLSHCEVDGLIHEAARLDARMLRVLSERDDAWFAETVEGYSLTRSEWLWETLEHEIHHVGQIAAFLRLAGAAPPRIFD